MRVWSVFSRLPIWTTGRLCKYGNEHSDYIKSWGMFWGAVRIFTCQELSPTQVAKKKVS